MNRFFKAFFVFIVITAILCVNLSFSVTAASTLTSEPHAKVEYSYASEVQCGTIRYISQNSSGTYFNWSYWPASSLTYYSSPANECGTASISMALSYIGINKTPKSILEPYDGQTMFGIGWGVTKVSTSSFTTAMSNYLNGNGKYSPPVIHLPSYSDSVDGHFVVVAGKISDNVYQILDPWDCGVTEITVTGTSATYNKYGTMIYDTIDQVHQWYNKNAVTEYAAQCSFNHSYLTIKLNTAANLRAQPCTTSVDATGTVVTTLKSGTELTVTGLYKNTVDEYWYKTTYDGKTCYFAAQHADIVEFLSSAKVSGVSAPDTLAVGKAFTLKGTVSSEYTYLHQVGASVETGTETKLQAYDFAYGSSYSIQSSVIDSGIKFNKLPTGYYKYIIYVGERSYYSTDGTSISEKTLWPGIHQSFFTVGSLGNTTPGKPVLTGLKEQYDADAEVTFNWGNTAYTTHYSLYINKKNTSGTYERIENLHYVKPGYSYSFEDGNYAVMLQAVNAREMTDDGSAWDYTNGDWVYFTVGNTILSGACGDNATWKLDQSTGVLTISGSGEMYDYTKGEAPWYAYRSKVTSVVIKDTITKIGAYTFYKCNNLAKLNMGLGVDTIGNYAFGGCTALSGSITFPGSMMVINQHIFDDTGVTKITIKGNVFSISPYAFYGCKTLQEIDVYPSNETYCSVDGVLFSEDMTYLLCYPAAKYGKYGDYYTVPDGVTTIWKSAFRNSTLQEVTIPLTVTEIADYAFYNCSYLTDVYYAGRNWEWNEIIIGENNSPLTSATLHCLGCVHQTVYVYQAKAATCTVDGNIAYRKCADCNKYYSDEDCHNEITLSDTVLKALGHSYKNGVCTRCNSFDPQCIVILAAYSASGQMIEVHTISPDEDIDQVKKSIDVEGVVSVRVFLLDKYYKPQYSARTEFSKTGFRTAFSDALTSLTYTSNKDSLSIYADAPHIDKACAGSVLRMYNLDLMTGDGKNFNPHATVTRAELAKMIYIALNGGVDDGASSYVDENLFSDVTADDWYAGYCNYCAVQKIDLIQSNTYGPLDPVSVLEAARMLLCAMGYSAEACGFVGDNWTNNVLAAAEAADLLDGFDYPTYTYVPRQWLAVMFCNAIDNA